MPLASRPDRRWAVSSGATILAVLLAAAILLSTPTSAAMAGGQTGADPAAASASGTFELTLQSTNSPVTEGQTLEFKVSVENTGESAGTQEVTLSVGEQQRDVKRVSLEPTELTTFTLTWETGDGDAGNYTAEVSSENDSVRPDVRVNAPKTSNFLVEIGATNAPVSTGDTLRVDARVANVGDLHGNRTVTLSIGAVERDSTTVSLEPGEATTVELTWETGPADAGNYTATVATPNDTAEAEVTVFGENRRPTANVSVEPSPPVAGESTTFEAEATDPDGNITTYVWTVDGEVASRDPTMGYTFEEPGTHEVTLRVTDDDGATTTVTRTVEVNVAPSASFSVGNTHPNVGEQVAFNGSATDPDGNVSKYRWSVDGEVVDSGSSFEYSFESGGDHEVTLTVTDDDGTNVSVTKTVTVNSPPNVRVTVATDDPTAGKPVEFRVSANDSDGTIESYTWRVDAAAEGENRTFNHVFGHPGEHEVTLTVTDDDGAEATHSITVSIAPGGTATDTSAGTDSRSVPGFGLVTGLLALALAGTGGYVLRRR